MQVDHECDRNIQLSIPIRSMGAVTGYAPMTECSQCGTRRPREIRVSAEVRERASVLAMARDDAGRDFM